MAVLAMEMLGNRLPRPFWCFEEEITSHTLLTLWWCSLLWILNVRSISLPLVMWSFPLGMIPQYFLQFPQHFSQDMLLSAQYVVSQHQSYLCTYRKPRLCNQTNDYMEFTSFHQVQHQSSTFRLHPFWAALEFENHTRLSVNMKCLTCSWEFQYPLGNLYVFHCNAEYLFLKS